MSDLSFSALKSCRDLVGRRTVAEARRAIDAAMAELTGARLSLLIGFDDSGSKVVCLAGSQGAYMEPVDIADAQWPEHPLNFLFSSKKALWEADAHAPLIEARALLFGMEAFGRLMVVPGRMRDQGYADIVHVLLVPSNIRPTRRTFSILSVFAGYGAALLAAMARRPERSIAAETPVPVREQRDAKASKLPPRDGIIGDSTPVRLLRGEIERFAPTGLTVLVTGETGTGKELVARALHEHSLCREGPFVAVNTTTLPSQLIESEIFGHVKGAFTGASEDHTGLIAKANGGTLFLDEIGDLPYALQAKLLRVLQEQRFRPVGADHEIQSAFRLVCATHRNLTAMVERGEFRDDLYYRINQATVHIAPLRERGQDILLLAEHFLDNHAARHGEPAKVLQPETRRALMDRPFAGNVRELMALMQRAAAAAGEDYFIHPDHLTAALPQQAVAAEMPSGMDLPEAVALYEREIIARTLLAHDGNRKLCAGKLGIPLRTLTDKLNRYGL